MIQILFLLLLFILLIRQLLSVFETLVTPDKEKLILVFGNVEFL